MKDLGFYRLNDSINLYKPPSSGQPDTTSPGLIIFCSWAFAIGKHIVKYLAWYQKLYPHARILLVQNDIHNMFWRPDAWQVPLFEPAVVAIKDYLSTLGAEKPKILLHLFSNGGAHTGVQLTQFYAQGNGALRDTTLPISALILDSAPGIPDRELGLKALRPGLPKAPLVQLIGPPLLSAIIAVSGGFHALGVSELSIAKSWRVLNDVKGPFLKDTIPRTYIFSDADEVIPNVEVKRHAQEAIVALEANGSSHPAELIRCEEFIGTGHVNHMLKNTERYWSICQDTWKNAVA
jgi:Eukaryotic protein of unknown function (DUF829)